MKRTLFLTIIILFFICAFGLTANAQQNLSTPRVAGDDCAKLLDKTLDAFEKAKNALKEKTAENQTNFDLRLKEEAYNAELLKAVAMLISSEKRNKTFFEKLQQKLEKILEVATDPSTLVTIATLIVLVKSK